jgi:hypothetical protein
MTTETLEQILGLIMGMDGDERTAARRSMNPKRDAVDMILEIRRRLEAFVPLGYETLEQKTRSRFSFQTFTQTVCADGVRAIKQTPKALLVECRGKGSCQGHWIAKSQIDARSEVKQPGDQGWLLISRWLAEQLGWATPEQVPTEHPQPFARTQTPSPTSAIDLETIGTINGLDRPF